VTSSELGGGQTAGTSRGSRNRRTFQDNVRASPVLPPTEFPSLFLPEGSFPAPRAIAQKATFRTA
jgi:hypothetical protein